MTNIKYAVEAILFAAGEPVTAAKLAVVLDVELDELKNAVEELKAEYNEAERGFNIIDIHDGYQICSRPVYYKYIQEIIGEQRNQPLSNAAMETLAIIAYKEPVTRGQIEKIRGVNSDGCVNRLYERGLIVEAGRLDAPGKPILYKTTDTFLRCFGLRSSEELPYVDLSKLVEPEQGEQVTILETDENNPADSAENNTADSEQIPPSENIEDISDVPAESGAEDSENPAAESDESLD